MRKHALEPDVKKQALRDIQKFFSEERDEELGDLAADVVLDFIIEKMGPIFYNQGVRDAHAFMSEKLEDLYGLEKVVRSK